MSAGIDAVLQAAVDGGVVPQVVAIAADRNGPIYEGAAGPRAVGESDPVTPDTQFRIASMTKMVATVAALQQVERGNLDLDAPVEQYRPEFADLQVLDGFDGDEPQLRPPSDEGDRAPARQPHQRALLLVLERRHRALRGGDRDAERALRQARHASPRRSSATPARIYEYGINTDWLGLVVEAASGQSLDAYFAEHILGPLGMSSTTFLMTPEQRANSVPVHLRGESGEWEPSDLDWSQEPDWWAGGHGLYSTPRDYLQLPAHAARRRRVRTGVTIVERGEPSTTRSPTRSATSTSRP